MKRLTILFLLPVIVLIPLVTGCGDGVSREDYDAVITERDTLADDLHELQAANARARAYWDILGSFLELGFIATTGDDNPVTTTMAIEMMGKIEEVDDPELERLFNAIIESDGGEQEAINFLLYLKDKISESLGTV